MGGLASVFPAYAGVSPPTSTERQRQPSLPRLRGGEPTAWFGLLISRMSSPPTRGRALSPTKGRSGHVVFPAYAGVSPRPEWARHREGCLPRLRGGEPVRLRPWLTRWTSSPPTRG